MGVETVTIDGKYRPEQWLNGLWQAVAYVPVPRGPNKGDRGGVTRAVSDRFHWTEADAQAECDLRNKK